MLPGFICCVIPAIRHMLGVCKKMKDLEALVAWLLQVSAEAPHNHYPY